MVVAIFLSAVVTWTTKTNYIINTTNLETFNKKKFKTEKHKFENNVVYFKT